MIVTVNGAETRLEPGTTVLALVESRGLRIDRIALELNGEIVPKRLYAQTEIHDADSVEIVSFVGGG